MAAPVSRYRSIVPDWSRFVEACRRPLPNTVRVNTLRIGPDRLVDRLTRAGFDVTRIRWENALLQLDRPAGSTIEHWLGLLYVQEASQLLPVLVLDPQPGEAVLDLCAAPGGKTGHIAARMCATGPLVANEPSGRRQPSLLSNVNRLGLLNATVTAHRGEGFPLEVPFDRVLVDAPCSAEGTLRKERSVWEGAAPHTIARLARLQKRLIVRAYDLLRPGGILVYSTCTFAPEENEEVVAHLLAARDAHLCRVELPVSSTPGLTGWGDPCYAPELQRCARVYPHHIDSGGAFIARLQRPLP